MCVLAGQLVIRARPGSPMSSARLREFSKLRSQVGMPTVADT